MNLKNLIDNLGAISDDLSTIVSQQATRFDELAVGVSESARELAGAARVARTTIERVDALLAGTDLGTVLGNAGESMENLKSFTGDMSVAMADMRTAAQQAATTMNRLEGLMVKAESGEGLAEGAVQAVANLNTLIADIQKNPGRYLSFSIF